MRIVEATSIEDFLNRYYKPSRRTPTLLASYEAEYRLFGYVCTSKHDNVIGEFIAWPHYPGKSSFLAAGRQKEGESGKRMDAGD